MAKKEKQQPAAEEAVEEVATAQNEQEAVQTEETFQEKYDQLQDSYLRLAADYDNFRKRTVKEKELSYGNGKADAIEKLLPVYDNLERALNQPTQDEAYKKGVEMTMNQLVNIFTGLGVEIFGEVGETFDPNIHNAVMHTEEEGTAENTITQVFQKGFKLGEKIVRFAMVQVAN